MSETPPLNARPSRRRVVTLALLWLSISGAALASPGCYGRNCEGGVETYGTDAGQGRMLDENTWESGPIDGEWIFFPRQRYYVFDIKALSGRTPQIVLPYLSAQLAPARDGNFTLGGGNLALLSNPLPNRIDIRNDSCSDYYIRLVVIAAPMPPPIDGGTPSGGDAGSPNDERDAGDAGDAGP